MDAVSAASSLFRPANAESFFGSTSPDAIIAAGQSASVDSEQQIALAMTTAAKREINRIRGYKLELSLAEKQKLANIQAEVLKIQEKAGAGTVRADELEDRTELLKEADRIIGKPIVDIEADTKLAEFNNLRLAVLAPKLDNATRKRVEFMQRFKDNLEQQIFQNPERQSLQVKFQAVSRQIDSLTPPRPITHLSRAEVRVYDETVELINDHAGAKVELTAAEMRRVAALEETIANNQALLPDFGQPSAQQASRAYVSLVL